MMSRKTPKVVLLFLVVGVVLPNVMCLPQPPTQEIIVDNRDPGFAIVNGWWGAADSTNGNGSYGPDFRYHIADKVSVGTARFTPTISQSGSYEIWIWWSSDTNRTPKQQVIVHSADGDTTYYVDLQQFGNMWYGLGTRTFYAGTSGYIDFTTDTSTGYCIADAVRLVPNF